MKRLLQAALVSLLLTGTGCELFVAKETLYLRTAQDRATQEEIQQRLGQPWVTTMTPMGEAVWVYDVYQIEPGSQQSWAATGSWCDEYVLTFDKRGVLRRWTHQSEKHGGELMPTYCVIDGFKPVS